MDVAEVAQEPATPLKLWTADEFIELLNEGLIEDSRRVEVVNGLMVKEMPQGPEHLFIFLALQRALAAMNGIEHGLATTPTLSLRRSSVVEPEFALLKPGTLERFGIPGETDVLWIVEVSLTSRRKDLTDKRDACAMAGISEYWVFDGVRRGVWVFSDPQDGIYLQERFAPAGEVLTVPVLGGTLETGTVFPPA